MSSVARVQPAPEMHQMATRLGYDCLLRRMSSGICESAAKLHRPDLERLGRRAEAECRFQDSLTDLRNQIAWKAAVRTRSASVDVRVELCSKAS